MMRNWRPTERIDTVLDRSIDRLDEEPLEAILRDYPQSGDTLAPMLQVADALRDFGQVSMPRAAKQAGRERLRQAVLSRQRRRNRPTLASGLRVAAWVAALLIVCTGSISGLTAASINALPSEPLYSWKRASEQVWLGMQTSPEREIAVWLALAERRVNEMTLLYQRSGGVDRDVISQLKVDYTRTLQLIDTLPPEQAQPMLAQAQAIGAEHERELMILAHQATGAEYQVLLTAVQVSQWVQHTSPDQVLMPTATPNETRVVPTSQPTSVPTTTIAPSRPSETPGRSEPIAPPAPTTSPATNPVTQPALPPTPVPPTPMPSAAPPVRNPPVAPQPTQTPRPAPVKTAIPVMPTAKPEPPKAKPTDVPPTAEPTKEPQPGPPIDPPGRPTDQPGPPIDPPGRPTAQPGPPIDPPGRPTAQPGPPIDPPGRPTDQPGPPIDPPGRPTDQPGPPIDPPGRPTDQPGPPIDPPGKPTAQPGPPIDPPGKKK